MSAPHRAHSKALGITADESDGKAQLALEAARQCWADVLLNDPHALWQWCLAQEQSILLSLLAYLAACTVNAVQSKQDRSQAERLVHANALAQALSLDMKRWYVPTAGNFFGRISGSAIVAAIDEAMVVVLEITSIATLLSATLALNSAENRLRVRMVDRPPHRRIHLSRLSRKVRAPLPRSRDTISPHSKGNFRPSKSKGFES